MPSKDSADLLVAPSPALGQSRYGWLAALLRARITQGQWPPGAALPAEAVLTKAHGVALGTMRQAIALLVAEGLLERKQGRGTFVCEGLGGASMLRFFRFRQGGETGAEGDAAAVPISRILKLERVPASAEVAAALSLSADGEVLQLLRLRSLNGRPCLLERLWLPLPAFEPLTQIDITTWDDLLYPMFQRTCGVTVQRAEDSLGFELLTAEQARRLKLPTGHPCVRVTRRAFDLAGHCTELRHTWGDAFAFHYMAQVR